MKIELNAEEQKYVCRAGLKLEKALAHFKVNLQGKVRDMAWAATIRVGRSSLQFMPVSNLFYIDYTTGGTGLRAVHGRVLRLLAAARGDQGDRATPTQCIYTVHTLLRAFAMLQQRACVFVGRCGLGCAHRLPAFSGVRC